MKFFNELIFMCTISLFIIIVYYFLIEKIEPNNFTLMVFLMGFIRCNTSKRNQT